MVVRIFRATTLLAGLLIFLLAGAGLYVHRQLPTLLEEQAKALLQEYGVLEVSLGQLDTGLDSLRIDTLVVAGETEGVAFSAILTNLELGYSWPLLRQRQLDSIAVAQLELTLQATRTASQSVSPAISVATLLPYSLMSRLPARALNLESWIVHYQPVAGAPLNARGKLRLRDSWELQLDSEYQGLALSGFAQGAESEPLTMDIQLLEATLPLLDLNARLDRSEGDSWRWSLQGELQYGPALILLQRKGWNPLAEGVLAALSGHSQFTATVDHPDTLDIQGASWQQIKPLLSISAKTSNSIEKLVIADTVAAVSGEFQAALGLNQGLLAIELNGFELTGELSTSQLALPLQLQQWLQWDDTLPAHWHSPGTLAVSSTSNDVWSVQLQDATLAVGNTASEQRWEALSIAASLNLRQPTLSSLNLSANIISLVQGQQLPEVNLRFSHPGNKAQHRFELSATDALESLQFTAQGSLDSNGENGRYEASLRSLNLATASATLVPLLQHFSVLDEEVKIADGSFILETRFEGHDFPPAQVVPQSELTIQDLDGAYGEYRFSGIELTANWTGVDHWQTQQSINFSMQRLFAGVELTDISARISLPERTPITQPVVSIEQFSSGLFGGRVYQTKAQQWNFAAPTNSLNLSAQGLQLRDIAALQQTQDITAHGVLDGELPVTVADGRLTIDHGYLRARAPGGTIQYLAGDDGKNLAASSPELAMAIDLLSDFQYRDLGSSVELDKAGNLLLKLKLAGSNPQLYGGHPIEFNINLEQNIDPLLQSLRLADKLVEQLDKRLR